jgi:hypothetical protein
MQMLYKPGTEVKINNLWLCDVIVPADEDDMQALLSDGWHTSAFEACVPKADRAKAEADIVKKSARLAEANARELASRNLDPTASRLINEDIAI